MAKLIGIIKKDIIYFIIIFVGIILYIINSDKESGYYEHERLITEQKIGQLTKIVIGKRIESIKLVVKEHDNIKVVMLYSGTDCVSCIEKGFKIIKNIDSCMTDIKTAVIGSNTNAFDDAFRYDYKKLIYYDSKQTIRQELQFCVTPALFLVDKNMSIKSVYFPTIYDTQTDVNKFVNSAMKTGYY